MKTGRIEWLWVVLCIFFSGLLLICGWLMPIHLDTVDATLLQRAGVGKTSLIEKGLAFQASNAPEVAGLLFQAAQAQGIQGSEKFAPPITHSESPVFPGGPALNPSLPVTPQIIRLEKRESLLAYLQTRGSADVQELLRTRELTNTSLFSASSSSSGQAFDAAVLIGGLLLQENHLTPGLRDVLVAHAGSAARGADSRPLEEILLDFLSLAQRFNWQQLEVFVSGINDNATLDLLTTQARNSGAQLPEWFAIVVLSQQPAQVAAYLNNFSQTGFHDLSYSLRYGEGGLNQLLRQRQRLNPASLRPSLPFFRPAAFYVRAASDFALRAPRFAVMVKWLFYILSGFLLAMAFHFARPSTPQIEKPLRVSGFHVIHECLFALGFLLVILLLSEPFLAREPQKANFSFRLRLPVAGAATKNQTSLVKTKLMDTRSLFTLALFFVLQGLIYCACLAKLGEIRRQNVPARVKLKLLENEEHLFDGGLYLGFAGTIVCLILVSLGVIQQSLMAAYSSTSFGIIFVSIFKIFNLRPVRRGLLMQAEEQTASISQTTPAGAPLLTTT